MIPIYELRTLIMVLVKDGDTIRGFFGYLVIK